MGWMKEIFSSNSLLSKQGNVLLIIAHPDDEVMFFTPTLRRLSSAGHHISILCLSNGNFEGIGNIRSSELIKSASMFKICANDVFIVDDPQLQDGMQNIWPARAIATHVYRYIQKTEAQLVLTFDEVGVSGHPNHIATYFGVKLAMSMTLNQGLAPPVALKLNTVHVCRKFSGVLEILVALLLCEYVVTSFGLVTALRGMYIHRSQNLWYRQVFVFISAYSYVNSFSKLT